ncbi:MAG: hypothetical protein IT349_15335, partial [Candidatus Eisenbacteria bacterium]|nr:hypothetical protein [Candidatus Eisenbacteria bacterium]
ATHDAHAGTREVAPALDVVRGIASSAQCASAAAASLYRTTAGGRSAHRPPGEAWTAEYSDRRDGDAARGVADELVRELKVRGSRWLLEQLPRDPAVVARATGQGPLSFPGVAIDEALGEAAAWASLDPSLVARPFPVGPADWSPERRAAYESGVARVRALTAR